ncbi:VOC family protein [Salinicoccus sp. HZC-1]|uniref:VOC family protein n=1 Tax=Salinicoccus sp. HZC-1 TaxID=3385497 RepID=UPI00398B3F3F
MMKQMIVPHLWFDNEALEAAEFYVNIFPNSEILNKTQLQDTPSGDAQSVTFEVNGYTFMAISAGPYFKINPSVSLFVNFDPSYDDNAEQNLEETWEKLKDGGTVLMPLDEYPYSKKYGFVQDRYGVCWQLILTDPDGDDRPVIIPSLMFVNDNFGRAEEAIDFYLSVFNDSKMGEAVRRGPEKNATIIFADFKLGNQWLAAMDGPGDQDYNFNEAVSLLVNCENQEEIDYYWKKLSAVPEAEQCGWLKDKYGVSWQITSSVMEEMMEEGSPEQIKKVTETFLKMKKFNIAELKKAYNG